MVISSVPNLRRSRLAVSVPPVPPPRITTCLRMPSLNPRWRAAGRAERQVRTSRLDASGRECPFDELGERGTAVGDPEAPVLVVDVEGRAEPRVRADEEVR